MGSFHWIKVRLFCYSTEDENKIMDAMEALTGTGDFVVEQTEGHHGNPIVILESEITKDRDAKALFQRLGPEMIERIRDELDDRVDDDCTFHLRLDKQKAVTGIYDFGRRGDVISITAKIVSHPARKEIALRNMASFLDSI